MAGNVSIETDAADNWKPSKKSRERIDGIVALIMALDEHRGKKRSRVSTTSAGRYSSR
jgi:phage terminase large subunit-like protein